MSRVSALRHLERVRATRDRTRRRRDKLTNVFGQSFRDANTVTDISCVQAQREGVACSRGCHATSEATIRAQSSAIASVTRESVSPATHQSRYQINVWFGGRLRWE